MNPRSGTTADREKRPLLSETASPAFRQGLALEVADASQTKKKPFNWKAPAIIIGFEFFESVAFSGIALNLVVYLGAVLHGNTASNAAHVDAWNGTTFLAPVIGAFLADSYLGKHKTIIMSAIVYLLGLIIITFSAIIPSLRPLPCDSGASCEPATRHQYSVFFFALYLVGIGTGGVKSALLPFGADQYNDADPEESQKKQFFFSRYFAAINTGLFITATLLVWVEQNVSWGLGYGICTVCLLIALVSFILGTPTYRMQLPTGSPMKNVVWVLAASFNKREVEVPLDSALLYEVDDKGKYQLAHTDGFSFLDKAATVTGNSDSYSPWQLCTVTQVEEVKILLRMLPIWANCILYAAAICQMTTTFIQQGVAMDTNLGLFSVPAASLVSIEVVCMLVWVVIQDKIVIPFARGYTGNPAGLSQLQRMGAGRFLMILAMAAAAFVEAKRLQSVKLGKNMSIAWQIPQFVALAGSDVFAGVAQLEFFYSEAPETMRSICSAFSTLALSLGFYLNSLVITIVAALTRSGGRGGWIPQNLNEGHLDYYFWLWSAISAVNFLVFVYFAKKYKHKKVINATSSHDKS